MVTSLLIDPNIQIIGVLLHMEHRTNVPKAPKTNTKKIGNKKIERTNKISLGSFR